MDDLPEDEYIAEALRRMHYREVGVADVKARPQYFSAVMLVTHTLKELGWKPPVDPLCNEAIELVCAESIARTTNQIEAIRSGKAGQEKVALALAALRRGMELAQKPALSDEGMLLIAREAAAQADAIFENSIRAGRIDKGAAVQSALIALQLYKEQNGGGNG